MIEITIITKENESFFQPFLPPKWKSKESQTMLGSIVDGTACGAFYGDHEDGESILKSIYVAPDYRRQGVGLALLKAGIKTTDYKNADYLVCRYALTDVERIPIEGLLNKCGFEIQEGSGKIYCTKLDDFSELKVQDDYKSLSSICALGQISNYSLQILRSKSLDASILPWIDPHDYDLDISCCFMNGETPLGCLLVESGDSILLRYLYVSPGTDPSSMVLLLRYALHQAYKRFDPEILVWINVLNQEMERLLLRISNNKAEFQQSVAEAVLVF